MSKHLNESSQNFNQLMDSVMRSSEVVDKLEALELFKYMTREISMAKRQTTIGLIQDAVDQGWYDVLSLNVQAYKRRVK